MDINVSFPLVSWNLAKDMPSALQVYKVWWGSGRCDSSLCACRASS